MSVSNILNQICKNNALQDEYVQILPWILKEKRIENLYSIEYVDLDDKQDFDTMRGHQFLVDFADYLMYTNGFDIVIHNVPEVSKLKYEDKEDKITAEHIFDTIKEIDETISDVTNFSSGVYVLTCSAGKRIVELLDKKLIGNNEIKVSLLRDNGKFKLRHPQKNDNPEEDICTTALVVSFFISLSFLFAFQYVFSSF
jgi:hypothetical protein